MNDKVVRTITRALVSGHDWFGEWIDQREGDEKESGMHAVYLYHEEETSADKELERYQENYIRPYNHTAL